MVREKPGFFASIYGIFDPGGDPGAIEGAADVCRKLAGQLTSRSEVLDTVAAQLLASWSKGEGRESYKTAADKFGNDLRDYSEQLMKAAKTLDEQAEDLEDARRQARNFRYMAIAAVAAGAALAVWSFGTSAAAAAAQLAIIKGSFMATMLRVGAALLARGMLMAAVRAACLTVAKRMFVGMALSWVATALVKGPLEGKNLLDPASWTANDASNILLGGILTGGLIQKTGLNPFKAGFVGGGLGGGISTFWLNDEPLSWKSATIVAASAGTGSIMGGALNRAGGALAPKLAPIRSKMPTMPWTRTGSPSPVNQQFGPAGPGKFSFADKVKAGTGIPTGVAIYGLNFTGILGAVEPKTGELKPPPNPPDRPDVPTLGPTAEQRRQAATQTVTVQSRGDSLYALAERAYGDGNKFGLIAEANNIGPPYTIHLGQVIKIPPIQVPAG